MSVRGVLLAEGWENARFASARTAPPKIPTTVPLAKKGIMR
jgi:hypothetical protein